MEEVFKGNSRNISDSSDQSSLFSMCLNRFPFTSLGDQIECMTILIHVVNAPTGHCVKMFYFHLFLVYIVVTLFEV